MSALRYRPELDGLRALAVYLVLLFHARLPSAAGGFIGVDLFFVLSGFLVTAVIWREIDARQTFSLGNFYARRVRRLLPAAIVVIVAIAAVQLLLLSLPARQDLVGDGRASLLYVANWHFIAQSQDYFGDGGAASPFLHFWSLSIEEQFYVFFPLLVLVILKWSHRPARLLGVVLLILTVLSVGLQVWRAQGDANYAYYASETRLYQLAFGAMLTLLIRSHGHRVDRLRLVAAPVALTGVVALLLVASGLLDLTPSARGLLATGASVMAIAGLWFAPQSVTAKALALPTVRFLGQVSYGTYLWHWPVLLFLGQVLTIGPAGTALLGAIVATALAALSSHVLERPIRSSVRLDPLRWPVVALGLATTIVAAAVVVPQILEIDRRPAVAVSSGRIPAGAELNRPVPSDLDLAAAKGDVAPQVPMCTTADLIRCRVVEGSGPHVLLLGDSQAHMLLPAFTAIAAKHDLTLSANLLDACAWQQDQLNLRRSVEEQASCSEARGDFYREVLPKMNVDVVIVLGFARSDTSWDNRLASPSGGPEESLAQLQLRTTNETASVIADAGANLIILNSVIGTGGFVLGGFDPIECLASATILADCAVTPPITRPAVDAAYGVLDTTHDDVATVDLNPVFCPGGGPCAPVVDDTVVWKDPQHVTTTYLVQRADKIWDLISGTGLLATAG
ncbi:MAG: acyltransferase family protein [Marmoricola sp.]